MVCIDFFFPLSKKKENKVINGENERENLHSAFASNGIQTVKISANNCEKERNNKKKIEKQI